ncbi:pleckstrin homology domain-containing family M member 2-like isoform X2 [Scleropages formosus]|uniref:pleckstrin homology domain-containing family M member 2-like isoform X2 n=1 Tax=Scleropages formosus TaxID=113540 RepID=UPI0010FA7909|nr:pleckstrin homology domain-containing family M member 2-like isoform X2 [Scleropages formosus]
MMDPFKVKDRILENISLSVKKLQSYFAACEDEAPAIRNHDRVLQRLCEHLDHALLYGLQDISLGYWVLVLHFTRKEAVRQIEGLQHIATHLGRSRAWLYLALSESSLESYLRLFQENQGLLHKYYFKNALVCSHDHLALFLTLVSGLEFIRFDLELDVPYLDVAAYMPECYKPQSLLDFEERLPGCDSLSLHSVNSTNLEWDDSAIAHSSDVGPSAPAMADGEAADSVISAGSVGADPKPAVEMSVISGVEELKVLETSAPQSPTFRHGPIDEDSDINTSTNVSPVHGTSRHSSTNGEDTESTSTELEVIRMARRRKPGKRRHGKTSSKYIGRESSVTLPEVSSAPESEESRTKEHSAGMGHLLAYGSCGSEADAVAMRAEGMGEEDETEALLRLPEMTDTSMDSVGQPLREVMDQLDGALELSEQVWDRSISESGDSSTNSGPPTQQPFQGDPEGEPPDLEVQAALLPQACALAPDSSFLQSPTTTADFYSVAPHGANPASQGGGHNDIAGYGQSQTIPSGYETEGQGEAPEGKDTIHSLEKEEQMQVVPGENGSPVGEEKLVAGFHPAEFRVDNNHLLLLMIHVFRETEEQLVKMVKMSTGHMEGDLQPLYLLLTNYYIYLLRKGAAEKPYMVDDAVSYSELDYISVGLDQQTITLVCTNRRRQFLLDTADPSLTIWFLDVLKLAVMKSNQQPPYPAVLTDATMERLSLTKFVSQESNCEVSDVCILFYSLVHWEDPLDVTVEPHAAVAWSSNGVKEGPLLYRAGTTYMGKELWKSCYLVLSNGILYQYSERTDRTPLLSISMGSANCGGCRRSSSTERPHAFQVILSERSPLELSANSEQDMADWMQVLCQSVSQGVIPQGVAPAPCIPCCLVLTDRKLLTCHQDCQTSFFRLLGEADLSDITSFCVERDKEYCIIEFTEDRSDSLLSWVLYFSSCAERDRLQSALKRTLTDLFQVCLPQNCISDPSVQKRCGEALALMKSAWQRSDSLQRGRSHREPWC